MTLENTIVWNRSSKITPANDCEVIMLDNEPLNVTSGKFEVATQHFYTNDNELVMPLFWAFTFSLEYDVDKYIALEKEKDR